MSQSLVKNLIHLVYGTKHRQPWIAKDQRDGLFAYQAGIFQEWESPALVIGGVEDHVLHAPKGPNTSARGNAPGAEEFGLTPRVPGALPRAGLSGPLRGKIRDVPTGFP